MQMTIENLDFNIAYSETTGHFPNHTARPVIGISGNLGDRGCELAEGYYRSVEVAGGIPVVIPVTDNRPLLLSLLDRIDGLLLSGGGDINPLLLGEDPCPALGSVTPERDRMELLLARLAFDRQIPILGICRGMQVLTAALGGRIHQDLATAMPGAPLLKHSQQMARGAASHRVTAEADSIVAQLLGTEFCVNSFHHQGVADAGPLLRVTARAADGVAEAVESNEMKSVVGVQWHPECFLLENDKTMMPLFRYFVEEAEKYRQVCEVHRQVLTLDSHCDTPMLFDRGYSPDRRDPRALVDLHKMTEGRLDAVVMAAYLPQGGRSGLGPLSLDIGVGAEALFLDQQRQAVFQLALDEIENHFGLNLPLGVEGDIIEANRQGDVAERVEQADVEPCAQGTTLGIDVVKFRLREAKLGGIELGQVLDDVVALHDALETAVPLGLCVAAILDVPLMIVEPAPFAAVVPPSVACRGDELVGGQLVEHVAAAYAPVSMLERAEGGAYHVVLGVVIILRSHLVIEGLVQVGAAGQGDYTQGCRRYMFEKLHFYFRCFYR